MEMMLGASYVLFFDLGSSHPKVNFSTFSSTHPEWSILNHQPRDRHLKAEWCLKINQIVLNFLFERFTSLSNMKNVL